MKPGDRVTFNGRSGTVKALQPAGMVDVCFDDSSHRIERRAADRLAVEAKPNGRMARRPRPPRRSERARFNPVGGESYEAQQLRERYTPLVEAYNAGQLTPEDLYPAVADWLFNESLYEVSKLNGLSKPRFDSARDYMSAWAQGKTDVASLKAVDPKLAKERQEFEESLKASKDDRLAQSRGYENWVTMFVDEAASRTGPAYRASSGKLVLQLATSLDPIARNEAYRIARERGKQTQATEYVPSDEELEEAAFVETTQLKKKLIQAGEVVKREIQRVANQKARASKQRVPIMGDNDPISEIIGSDGAGYFTRPDPSRVSTDGTAFCGNPIDSTAYYLIIEDGRNSVPVFLKQKLVEQAFNSSGRSRDAQGHLKDFGPDILVQPTRRASSLKNVVLNDVIPALLAQIRTVLSAGEAGPAPFGEARASGKKAEKLEAAQAQIAEKRYLKTEAEGALAQVDRAIEGHKSRNERVPPRLIEKRNDLTREVLVLNRDIEKLATLMVGLQGQSKAISPEENHFLRRAMVYIGNDPVGTVSQVKDLDQDIPLSKDNQVQVKMPSLARIKAIEDFFVTTYLPEQDERFDISVSRQPVRGQRFIRGRERRGLSEDLAKRERSGKPAGQVPKEHEDFYYWNPEDDQEYYFIVYQQSSLERQKLSRFQAYRMRRFRYEGGEPLPLAWSDDGAAALPLASRKSKELAPLGVHPVVASMFAVSGGITVNGQFETNPEAIVNDCTMIMSFREKANSPFYSWIREDSPVLRSESRQAKLPDMSLFLRVTGAKGITEYLARFHANPKEALEQRLRWAARDADAASADTIMLEVTQPDGSKNRKPFSKEIVEAGFLLENADSLRDMLRPRTDWSDCLSATDKETETRLRRLKNALWAYKKALRDIQYLFSRLDKDPSMLRADPGKVSLSRWDRKPVNDVDSRIAGLASAYAFLLKTIARIRNGALSGNPSDTQIYNMLVETAGLRPIDGDPNYVPSVLQEALEMFRGDADKALLLGEEMDVRALAPDEIEPFKMGLEHSILREKPVPFGALIPVSDKTDPVTNRPIAVGFTPAQTDIPRPGRSAYRWLREGGYRATLESLIRKRYGDKDWNMRTIVKTMDMSPPKKNEPFANIVARVKGKAKLDSSRKLPAGQLPDLDMLIGKMILSDEVTVEALRNRFYFDRNLQDDVKLTHPMDDLVLYALPSLEPDSQFALLKLREKALQTDPKIGLNGVLRLRMIPGVPTREEDVDAQSSPNLFASANYRDFARAVATGGTQTQGGGRIDPVALAAKQVERAYSLLKPSTVGTQRVGDVLAQQDANWAISHAVASVFPSLVFKKRLPAEQAANMAADLILLARMYDDLGGYRLTGPLNPDSGSVEKVVDSVIDGVTSEIVKLRGGTIGLTSSRDYTVFKTYNPVLFELTRLFWPTTNSEADPSWSSILAHPELMQMLDQVGRFGYTVQLIQQKALGVGEHERTPASCDEELIYRLRRTIEPVIYNYPRPDGTTTPVSLQQLMMNWLPLPKIKGVRYTRDELRAPPGLYAPFLLTWPLGMATNQVVENTEQWMSRPADYLKLSKNAVSEGMKKVMTLRTRGMPRKSLREIDPVIAGIAEGQLSLDPAQPPTAEDQLQAWNRLSTQLTESLPRAKGYSGLSGTTLRADFTGMKLQKRAQAEKEALKQFQKRPGHVLEAQQGATKLTALPPVPDTGVYDANTVKLLEMRREAGSSVTGQIKPVMGERAAIYAGDPKQRLRGSVVVEAQHGKTVEYQDDLRSIDKRLKTINTAIEVKQRMLREKKKE